MEVKIISVLLLISFLNSSLLIKVGKLNLKQVLILSRHNVRTPLAKTLTETTPKAWPHWTKKPGYLTDKGVLLEGFMGEFFASWFRDEQVLPEDCPEKEMFYVYANSKQRTKASARAFVDKAFPGCNITINHKDDVDPVFDPVIHNNTDIFKETAYEEMHDRLRTLHLNRSYEELQNLLDYNDSVLCKTHNKCNLVVDKNQCRIEVGAKPKVEGPLKISNSVIDAFIMENYQGFPNEEVAWGQLDQHKWRKIMKLHTGYHNVIFNTTLVAKDISEPLIKIMADIFLNDYEVPKVTLLMGHDANLYTILSGMNFKSYNLPEQYEKTPVGGKLVFQKWRDGAGVDFLKINYVYQSTYQMRNAVELSKANPPLFVLLELNECRNDADGFCPWEDFRKLLINLRA